MSRFNETILLAFRDELLKEAGGLTQLIEKAAPRLRAAGSVGGVGAAGGAALGGVVGGVRKYQQAKEEGAGTGGALLSGTFGALGGAGTGAALGGAAGMGAGAISRRGADWAAREGALGATARFGQRQVHGLTGFASPHEYTNVLRGGAYDAQQAATQANKTLALRKVEEGRGSAAYAKAKKKLQRADQVLDASRDATGLNDKTMNLTSLPGIAHAVRKHGPIKPLTTAVKEQWRASPKMTAAMGVLPVGMAGMTLAQKEQPDGPGKGEQLGENVAGTLGMAAAAAMPVGAGMLPFTAASGAGKMLGRGVDRLRGRKAVPQAVPGALAPAPGTQPEGQHVPVEHVSSPAAAGQQNWNGGA